jgi:hypothetical protein
MVDLPTMGLSPTRPGSWAGIPPVDVPKAKLPDVSSAHAPTVSWEFMADESSSLLKDGGYYIPGVYVWAGVAASNSLAQQARHVPGHGPIRPENRRVCKH